MSFANVLFFLQGLRIILLSIVIQDLYHATGIMDLTALLSMAGALMLEGSLPQVFLMQIWGHSNSLILMVKLGFYPQSCLSAMLTDK